MTMIDLSQIDIGILLRMMENAQPGHTVELQGLQGAAHLNGTQGTLIQFHRSGLLGVNRNAIKQRRPRTKQLMY